MQPPTTMSLILTSAFLFLLFLFPSSLLFYFLLFLPPPVSSLEKVIYYFLGMGSLSVHVSVYHVYVWYRVQKRESEALEGTGHFQLSGVTGVCKLSCGIWVL